MKMSVGDALNLDDMLVVAITSRALFDLHESDRVYREQGLDAYRAHQLEREDEPLNPGTAFPLVRGLLGINDRAGISSSRSSTCRGTTATRGYV